MFGDPTGEQAFECGVNQQCKPIQLDQMRAAVMLDVAGHDVMGRWAMPYDSDVVVYAGSVITEWIEEVADGALGGGDRPASPEDSEVWFLSVSRWWTSPTGMNRLAG